MTDREYARRLADDANARMAIERPRRAEEIEWFVDSTGSLRLRDRPEWSSRRTRELEVKAEQSRRRWKAAQDLSSQRGEV